MINNIDRRTLLAAGMAMTAKTAWAQSDTDLVRVVLKTSQGAITLDLDQGKAPITARNFLRYVDLKRLDHSCFYRASHIPGGTTPLGLIQGGLRGDRAKLLKPIAHESTLKTGLSHKNGTISMARAGLGTADADFFICIGDMPGYDANPNQTGDNEGFAAFGQVVDGMDVVQTIWNDPTSATEGVGVMRGEMLKPTVPILTARRTA